MLEAEPLVEIAMLAVGLLDRLDRGVGRNVVVLLVGAGERGADAAQRRALEKRAEEGVGAEPDPNIDAVGDH